MLYSYRELFVWQKSLKLVAEVYCIIKKFPADEIFSLTSQIKRSVISIPSNIAEGYGRNHKTEYIRFLQIARGSLYELQTQLEIALILKYLVENEIN